MHAKAILYWPSVLLQPPSKSSITIHNHNRLSIQLMLRCFQLLVQLVLCQHLDCCYCFLCCLFGQLVSMLSSCLRDVSHSLNCTLGLSTSSPQPTPYAAQPLLPIDHLTMYYYFQVAYPTNQEVYLTYTSSTVVHHKLVHVILEKGVNYR